jgi:hypothetical protein
MDIHVPLISMGVFALEACLAAITGGRGGGVVGVYPGADFEILSFSLHCARRRSPMHHAGLSSLVKTRYLGM